MTFTLATQELRRQNTTPRQSQESMGGCRVFSSLPAFTPLLRSVTLPKELKLKAELSNTV